MNTIRPDDTKSMAELDDTKNISDDKLTQQKSHVKAGVVASIRGEEAEQIDPNLPAVEEAIEAIGMGNYQWQLTFSSGFGFLVDQMSLVSISLVPPQAALESGPKYSTLLSAALYAGLLTGALVVGQVADIMGRKLVWQASLFGSSVFTLICASSPSWAVLNVFVALVGFFGGGNLAIDLAILAECLPMQYSFVLTGLASVWGLGNAITGLIAWPLLARFSCPSDSDPSTCDKADNLGWRYLYIILGSLCLVMSALRSFALHSQESPKWLVTNGRISETVEVLNNISTINKSDYRVSSQDFASASSGALVSQGSGVHVALKRAGRLFTGPKQLRLMLCLLSLWALVGIVYPLYTVFLPYYLASHGAKLGTGSTYQTYRDWSVSSIVGMFGPLVSMGMVRVPWLGNRRSITITAVICASFSAAFTTVKTESQNLAFSSMSGFWLNALYSIIYSYTPLALKTENRGLGCGLLMGTGRLLSLSAPFIATFSDVTSAAPIWIACALYVVLGIVALFLPFEATPSYLGHTHGE